MEIRRVLIRKDGIKLAIIPKKSEIQAGDFVKITKWEDDEVMKTKLEVENGGTGS